MELELGLLHAVVGFAGVDDEDDGVGGARVRLPQGTQLLLPAHIPHEEGEVARPAGEATHALAVEADRGHGVHVLVELQPE